MWRFYVAVGLVWVAFMPPLFTRGACSAELADESARVSLDAQKLEDPTSALGYWQARAVPVSILTPAQCRARKPRFLSRCGSGPLVYATVPVKNLVCRYYRDDEIKVLLQYDDVGRLAGLRTDMSPFRTFPIPFTQRYVDWGR